VALLIGGAVWASGGGEDPQAAPSGTDETEALEPEEPEEPESEPDVGVAEGAEEPEDAGEPSPDPEREPEDAGVPEGWTRSDVGPVGASVAHPAAWQRVDVDGTRIDHRDPGSSAYVRTDWTDQPAGDPVEDWQRQSQAFGQSREGYEEIRIDPATVDGREAAIWEYRYIDGGARLRAINVAIVDDDHAYAVNVQTTEDAWADLQPTTEAIIASFSAG
jgi:hypothetical protein